jgi:hypothetical protein
MATTAAIAVAVNRRAIAAASIGRSLQKFVLCSYALFPTCSFKSSAFRKPLAQKIRLPEQSALDFAAHHG